MGPSANQERVLEINKERGQTTKERSGNGPTPRQRAKGVTLYVYSPLLIAHSLANIVITEKTATKPEGSCVTITCTYTEISETLLWFKNPEYIHSEKRFNGTIVYSNTKEHPQSTEYLNRVHFLSEDKTSEAKSCSLRITDLQKQDSGQYNFRYINTNSKYMSKPMVLSITGKSCWLVFIFRSLEDPICIYLINYALLFVYLILDNPCKVHLNLSEMNKTIKEGDTLILHCATSATCEFPEWDMPDTEQKNNIQKENPEQEKNTKLTLKVNWEDDKKTLKCHPANNNDDCLARGVTLNVQYAPKDVKLSERDKIANEGEDVKITCSSKAHPNATFKWRKRNNQSTIYQEGMVLNLPSIKPEDSGKYYCEASNIHGNGTSHDIDIDVFHPPKGVRVIATSNSLKEGDNLTLTCMVTSSKPEVQQGSYKWFKDNIEIVTKDNSQLTFLNIEPSQNGTYYCQAINSVQATASDLINISVKYAPQNTAIHGTSEVKLGHTLDTLRCTTDANPPPNNYSWYFKQENTHKYVSLSQTRSQNLFGFADVSDAGWYMCSARNALGSGSNSTEFQVSVLYPPRQLNLNIKPVVKESEKLTIQCTVKSSPQSTLTLRRTSVMEPQGNLILSSSQTSNILTFSFNVSESDSGIYTCTAKNTEGQNYTKQDLKVLYSPKNVTITAHPGTELKEGFNLTLTCTARSDPPVSSYSWMKSVEAHSVKVGDGPILTQHFLKDSYSGNYSCIAKNYLGSTHSAPVHIKVKYRPHITVINNVTLLAHWAGDVPVHLSCNVHCYPPATSYAWYRLEDETALSNSQSYTVQPQNPGTYYCSATNEMGSSKSELVQLYANSFSLQYFFISIFVVCILIGIIFLVHRFLSGKKFFGTKEEHKQSFFLSIMPTLSSTLSDLHLLGSRINTQENLVTEGITERRALNNPSTAAANQNISASRNQQGSLSNIHTMHDAPKLSQAMPKGHRYTEDDLTTINYATLQFPVINHSNKSASKNDGCEIIYANVSNNKQKPKNENEDYENVIGAFASKPPFSNTIWDWDSSDEEEEVNYSTVSITVTAHHNPRKPKLSSEDEDKTEYSEIKV
ncbi:LOW QUALITY PROTEIN: B-cell receptor CD22 [Trichomycterus rosablanca]|uniref:LOW QUALITY PROTEIN: B-cell receptor CD22 n=1 Tax=Trichomycterus rosablanca TaxID=2290929 RepID=UPI002F35226B